jgi:hypothetical protein
LLSVRSASLKWAYGRETKIELLPLFEDKAIEKSNGILSLRKVTVVGKQEWLNVKVNGIYSETILPSLHLTSLQASS